MTRTTRMMENLRDLAAVTPELAPIANRANDLLRKEMRDAQQAFNQTMAMGWVNEGVVMCTQP